MSRSRQFAPAWSLAVVLAGAAALLCRGMSEPFVRQHESASASVANYARNFLRYGYARTKLALIVDSGPLDFREPLHYYLHCTPLLSLLASISFRLFGVKEWAVRLVPILQALACVAWVWLIASRLWGRDTGLAAAAILAGLPVFAYYGRVAEFVTFTLGFILASAYAYLRWRESGARGWFALMLATSLLAALTSFEGWLWPIWVFAHYLRTARPRRRAAWLLPLMTPLAVGLQAAHAAWLIGPRHVAQDAAAVLARRGAFAAGHSALWDMAAHHAAWAVEYFTPMALVLAAAGAWRLARGNAPGGAFVAALAANRALVSILFAGHAAAHEFTLYGYAPAIAMAAALGIQPLWRAAGIARRRSRRAGAAAACALTAAAFLVPALREWDTLHTRRYYSPWYEFARRLHDMTTFDQGVALNLPGPLVYPGYYLPFYLDRRIAWRVGSLDQAKALFSRRPGRYALAAFFGVDTNTGRIIMRTYWEWQARTKAGKAGAL